MQLLKSGQGMQEVLKLADPARDANPLWIQFLSFSSNFQEKFEQLIGWRPLLGHWRLTQYCFHDVCGLQEQCNQGQTLGDGSLNNVVSTT